MATDSEPPAYRDSRGPTVGWRARLEGSQMGQISIDLDDLLASKEYKKFIDITGLGKHDAVGSLCIVWADSLLGKPVDEEFRTVVKAMIQSGLSTDNEMDPHGYMEHQAR